jgi:uncharacterized protein (DUF4213/DUF364 family)
LKALSGRITGFGHAFAEAVEKIEHAVRAVKMKDFMMVARWCVSQQQQKKALGEMIEDATAAAAFYYTHGSSRGSGFSHCNHSIIHSHH